jgi:predicted nuclease of restriction endonuclease-like (RecB) superfamily
VARFAGGGVSIPDPHTGDAKEGAVMEKGAIKPNDFFNSVGDLIEHARDYVGRTADLTKCITYFEIGRKIVEEEQGGNARADYGAGLLKALSQYLTERCGRGFSLTNLKQAKKFYLTYAPSLEKGQTPSDLFKVGWSHYLILMRIENDAERRFYEIEAANGHWSYAQLQRQYGSSLYERLALSRDKDEVMRLANKGQIVEQPRDMLKNPLVLEFLGMEDNAVYSETELESAIITHLQQFLLELGKGFLFEARQKRFTFDEDHFCVDLVFYNRILQCYVIIDLKTGKLKHQDLGQMQMYVNYFDRYVKLPHEKPTIGILLCKEQNNSVVKLTLPEDTNIYSSAYNLCLPDKGLLQRKLAEWTQEFEAAQQALNENKEIDVEI